MELFNQLLHQKILTCIEDKTLALKKAMFGEILSRAVRIAKARKLKMLSKIIARKRKIKMRRKKTGTEIHKKAGRDARAFVKKKLVKGKSLSDLSIAEKERLEKMLQRKKGLVKKLTKRFVPKARQKEAERIRKMRTAKKGQRQAG